ncbi:MAG: hypothetical protein K1X88_31880 [Nannocystaceae bacterium]|nr:hypothetical protein [Nannocystaceae bacterium]
MSSPAEREPSAPTQDADGLVARRRLYVEFGDAILGDRDASEPDAFARLRLAGTAIVKLLGDQGHADAPANERATLRGLHERILAWMREEPVDAVLGLSLWREVVDAIDAVMRVNDEPALLTHDLVALRACLDHLEAGDLSACRERAGSLVGRDAALDRRIRGAAPTAALRASLRRVLLSLVREQARRSRRR